MTEIRSRARSRRGLLAVIRRAVREETEILDLSGNGIKEFPAEVNQLTNLKELILRGNDLITLPESIGELSELRYLEVGSCKLTSVPEPVNSSARFTSPAPKPWTVPSFRPVSASPDRVMMCWRRRAMCQSLKKPGPWARKTVPLVSWSSFQARSSA